MRGMLVTFEGVEGSGKTTQAARLPDALKAEGLPVASVREPGGTALGEKVREILLSVEHHDMPARAEPSLYTPARAHPLKHAILPPIPSHPTARPAGPGGPEAPGRAGGPPAGPPGAGGHLIPYPRPRRLPGLRGARPRAVPPHRRRPGPGRCRRRGDARSPWPGIRNGSYESVM